MDHLIKEEKSKVGFGGDPACLIDLEQSRHQHSEFVKAMTRSMESGRGYRPLDENGVYQLVQKLYSLLQSGNDAATFGEKHYPCVRKESLSNGKPG